MKTSLLKSALALILASVVTACGGSMDDLDRYINDTKARPGGRIDPLPEIKPYEVFTYVADAEGMRSPFVPDSPQANSGNAANNTRPDRDRSREYLEDYPLDALRMVGTMELGGVNFGLVITPEGIIERVVPGNYIGQNDGRIVSVTESEIELVEIISDGIGGYLEREAAVVLTN